MVAGREAAGPIGVHHFEVLGDIFPQTLRRILDLPAYWLILLPLEFPATFIAGALSLIVLLRRAAPGPERTAVQLFGVLAVTGLAISWLLVSALGDNNGLGLRAMLPAAVLLVVAAVAGIVAAPGRAARAAIAAAAFSGLILSLPDSAAMIYANWRGNAATDASAFAEAPEL